jgi:hypothetical protein
VTDDKKREAPIEENHPQTIKLEDNARGGAEAARYQPEPPDYESESEEASAVPADAELDEDAEAVREHAAGAGTIGEGTGSGVKPDVGSGTPQDRGALGSGKPPNTEEGAEPLGTYTPGGRD